MNNHMKPHDLITSILLFSSQIAFAQTDVIYGGDHFEFTYSVTLPQLDRAIGMWLPLAKTDSFQTVKVERISAPVAWRRIADRDYQNDILVMSPGPGAELQKNRDRLQRSPLREIDLQCQGRCEALSPARASCPAERYV